jgi:phage tail sheath protein FI
MPTYQYPAVYVAEVEAQVRPIEGVSTSTAALLGPDCLAHLRARIERLPPKWTDAKRGDPGIALLELVAWISESLLYRGGRMPDRAARSLSRVAAASLQSLQGCRLPKGSALKKIEVFATRVGTNRDGRKSRQSRHDDNNS